MFQIIKRFTRNESGAITVDWVVLTAAVVGLAVAAYLQIETSTHTLANAAGARIGAEPLPTEE